MSNDVSRETAAEPAGAPPAPPLPGATRGVFASDRLLLIERYAGLLADQGVVRGLIGPREVPRLWERHLLNCAVLADAIPEGVTVCDIGSGAGLPGTVLAIRRPDLRVTLLEPLLRRTTFLSEVVDDLSLENVEVVRGRADALHGQRVFDVVTSRAVAPLGRLLDWSMPLVDADGSLVAMKGSSVSGEIEEARGVWQAMGCAEPEVLELGGAELGVPTFAVRVSWADPEAIRLARARAQSSSGSRPRTSPARRPRRRRS